MNPTDTSRPYTIIWSIVWPSRGRLLLGFIGLFFVSCTSLVYPSLLRVLVDHSALAGFSSGSVFWLGAGLVGIFATASVVGYFQQSLFVQFGYELRNSLRSQLADSLLEKPLLFHQHENVGEFTSRLIDDTARLQSLFSNIAGPFFQNLLIVVGCLGLMMSINFWNTGLVLVVLIAFLPATLFASKRIKAMATKGQGVLSKANAIVEEALAGIREIKSFARETHEGVRYSRELHEASKFEMGASRIQILLNQVSHFVVSLLFISIFLLGTKSKPSGPWTLGSIIAFYFYAYTMTISFIALGRTFLSAQTVVGPLGRVAQLISEQQNRSSNAALHRGRVKGSIRFSNVSFQYPESFFVLKELNFDIRAGEWVVVQGPSGSGKSTLASLMMGLLTPSRGVTSIDGVSLTEWHPQSVRSAIGYAAQEPHIFNGTLRDNLFFGRKPVSQEFLDRVLETTCLNEFINARPNGIDGYVEENGKNLSGGQRARLAIARALLIDPEILILDEVTHSIEKELESVILNRLHELRQSRTMVIFTHHSEGMLFPCRKFTLCNGSMVELGDVQALVVP